METRDILLNQLNSPLASNLLDTYTQQVENNLLSLLLSYSTNHPHPCLHSMIQSLYDINYELIHTTV